ncbi:MAG: hypothetical protein ASARMPRED_005469 [Alectoria sarmentosa]|nr:MAG: hypothetical protein ASARMPRED_005469 [Alectoria sarmentosa]
MAYTKYLKEWSFHLYSVWLFTFSDLKTIVLSSTTFGLFGGIAISFDDASAPDSSLHILLSSQILSKIPLVVFWVWINLLPFAINNQRQPEAIQEDSLNKPWRTMPSKRLSPASAKRLMFTFYLVAVVVSFFFDNLKQCLTLVLLGHWYNNLRGADANCLVRNFINACGFSCFSSGAMQVAIGGHGTGRIRSESALQPFGWWYVVIACVIFSTVQTQDMYDQRGDAARNRKTVPLVIGDGPARWTIAVPMAVWCWATPWLWASSNVGYVGPVTLGLTVAFRTLRERSEDGDKNTFRLWNLWLVSVYILPLIKALETYLGGKAIEDTMRYRLPKL